MKNNPIYHIYKNKAWINDPNGFIYFKNKFHLFAQCYPHDLKWGPMEWAHFTSLDLIKWKDEGIAFKGSENYDAELGCFSGSSIVKDDVLNILYTGVSNDKQQQCLITSTDGKVFVKDINNPVIGEIDLPKDYQIKDFRDPKIVFVKGTYYILIGARHIDGSAHLLLYKSLDLKHFKYVGSLYRYKNKDNGMIECPDLFYDGNNWVLIMCPQFSKGRGNNSNIHSVIYLLCDIDFEKGILKKITTPQLVDYGFDFYATQTLTKDNKTYLVAWQSMWDRNYPSIKDNYVGQMTSIREVKVISNHLHQYFLDELKKYYLEETFIEEMEIKDKYLDKSFKNRNMRVTFDLNIDGNRALIYLNSGFEIDINKSKQTITFKRKRMDEHIKNNDGTNAETRRIHYLENMDSIHFDILIDNSCIEILINDGLYAFSSLYYKKNGNVFKVVNKGNKTSLLNYHKAYLRRKI